jgi:hypothetical protein
VSDIDYSWKRYWLPLTSEQSASGFLLDWDSPYLVDPEEDRDYWLFQNQTPLTLKKVLKQHCVLLLGERGIGKTRCLNNEKVPIERGVKATGDDVLWVDLADCGSDRLVDSEIFEDQRFQSWKNGSHNLHLFLDSFDECQEFVPKLAELLSLRLRKCDTNRLRLRVICRTSHWPKNFDEQLNAMWAKSEGLHSFQLLPLTRANVAAALSKHGVNADKFFSSVQQTGLEPLCARPLTLELQIAAFKKSPTMTMSVVQTYENGIKTLLQTSTGLKLTEKERIFFASRIAAATMFCNRAAIWTGGRNSDPPNTDVLLEDLCFESESRQMRDFPFSEIQILKEVLASGLFKAAGLQRIVWAHQTFAEFLAAYYLGQRKFTDEQVLSLLVHPLSRSGEVIPQLRGVAAWLSEMRPAIGDRLNPLDRATFLKSDIPFSDDEKKRATVEAIMQAARAKQLTWEYRDVRWYYRKLGYEGLGTHLKTIILDDAEDRLARTEAFSIAQRCGAVLLSDDELISILYDDLSPLSLLYSALSVVILREEPATLLKLLPLARKNITSDPMELIKTQIMDILWTKQLISPKVFLEFLSEPKRPGGSFSNYMVSTRWWNQLPADDLDVVLQYLDKLADTDLLTMHLGIAAQSLIDLALKHLDDDGVLERLTQIFLKSLKSQSHQLIHWKILYEISRQKASTRRGFVQTVLGNLRPEDVAALLQLFKHAQPLDEKDLRWLRDFKNKVKGPESETILLHLLTVSGNQQEQGHSKVNPYDLLEMNEPRGWIDFNEAHSSGPGSPNVLEIWTAVDSVRRNQMIRSAKRFLENAPALPGIDLDSRAVSKAAYRAMVLLSGNAEVGEQVSQAVRRTWAAAALRHYFDIESRSASDQEIHCQVLKDALENNPELSDRALAVVSRNDHIDGRMRRLADIIWNDRGENAFLEHIERLPRNRRELEGFVDYVLEKAPHTIDVCARWMQNSEDAEDDKAIVAASIILRQADPNLIKTVMTRLEKNAEFASHFFRYALDDHSSQHSNLIKRLSEPQIFSLFHLLEQYGSGIDVPETTREHVSSWQSLCLFALQERGTPAALQVLSKIEKFGWDMALNESRQSALRVSWTAPQPDEFLDLISNSNRRLIRSERELLQAVIESLASFEAGLQGETPLAFTLWDKIREGRSKSESVWKPKDENSFSDVIKHHLIKEMKERGLFINREVEIVRARAGGQGERLDIDVSALIQGNNADTYEPIKVVVEVKGSWNAGLFESMETQLADRYLNTLECTHGIYLVGWFFSNKSDKKYVPAKMTLETLRSKLAEQATALSNKQRTIRAVVIDATLK